MRRGQRLNVLYRENIDEADILAALDPLWSDYASARIDDEAFGDFLVRKRVVAPATKRHDIPVEILT